MDQERRSREFGSLIILHCRTDRGCYFAAPYRLSLAARLRFSTDGSRELSSSSLSQRCDIQREFALDLISCSLLQSLQFSAEHMI